MQAHELLSAPVRTGVILLTTDAAGRISSLGNGLAAAFGRSSSVLLGSPLTGLFPPDQAASIQHAAREAPLRASVSLKTRCRMWGSGTEVLLHCHAADGPQGGAIWQIEPLKTTGAGRRAEWADAIAALNEVTSRTLDRSLLAAAACRAAVTEGAMRMAWIGVVDPATAGVKALSHAGHEDGYLAEASIAVNGGRGADHVAEAIETGVLFVSHDIAQDARTAPWRKAALARGYAATAALPLFVEGRPIGVLALYSAEVGAFFSPGERTDVLDFAARISLGFELTAQEEARKAAESALRSKLRQQASIAALGAAAIGTDTTKALFHEVARRVASTLEVELVRVMEAASDGSKLVTRAAVGFELSKGREVTPDEDAVAGFAVRQGPIIVRDLSAEGFTAAMLTANGVVSGVEAPITSPAGAIGLVGAFSRTERRFTDDDVIYLKGVAALVGVAVARLRAEALFHQSVQGERDRGETTQDDLEREVSERNAELKAAVDELEAFTYSVSHDLRAPLRAVRGFAGILLEEQTARLDDEGIRQLHVIADSAERMGDLIDDLLSLSRIGRREPNLGEVDLNAAADGAIATCKQAHSEHPALVRRSELGRAIADRGLLDHLFLNLIDNAFKFTSKREDPVIEIGLVDSPEPDEAVVCVRDNGAGFDQRHIDQLFQPFHRLHQVADFPGTGIGLAVVARVAQKIGARVWAEGQPDRGATFFVALKKGGSHG